MLVSGGKGMRFNYLKNKVVIRVENERVLNCFLNFQRSSYHTFQNIIHLPVFQNFSSLESIFSIKPTHFEYFKVSIKDYNYAKLPYDLLM
jgi:hypothetical protein